VVRRHTAGEVVQVADDQQRPWPRREPQPLQVTSILSAGQCEEDEQ
jgi:hypothetical protein